MVHIPKKNKKYLLGIVVFIPLTGAGTIRKRAQVIFTGSKQPFFRRSPRFSVSKHRLYAFENAKTHWKTTHLPPAENPKLALTRENV
jgi:hypothetical protein